MKQTIPYDAPDYRMAVCVDGTTFDGVRFFNVSPQFPTYSKQFPVAVMKTTIAQCMYCTIRYAPLVSLHNDPSASGTPTLPRGVVRSDSNPGRSSTPTNFGAVSGAAAQSPPPTSPLKDVDL